MKPEKFKIWYIHQVPGKSWEQDVPDPVTGQLILEAIYQMMLFLYKNKMIPDYANAGGVVYFDEKAGEWWDYDPEEWEEGA